MDIGKTKIKSLTIFFTHAPINNVPQLRFSRAPLHNIARKNSVTKYSLLPTTY